MKTNFTNQRDLTISINSDFLLDGSDDGLFGEILETSGDLVGAVEVKKKDTYIIYGMAETHDGRRYIGFGDYFFGVGHKGVFESITHKRGSLAKILCGGEMYIRRPSDGVGSKLLILQVNQTSGYISMLMKQGATHVFNDMSYLANCLNVRNNFIQFASDAKFFPYIEGGINHLHPALANDSGNFRHVVGNIIETIGIYSSKNKSIDCERLEVLIELIESGDRYRIKLIEMFENLIKALEIYSENYPYRFIRWQYLHKEAKKIQSSILSDQDKTLKYFHDFLIKSHTSANNLKFFVDLDCLMQNVDPISISGVKSECPVFEVSAR